MVTETNEYWWTTFSSVSKPHQYIHCSVHMSHGIGIGGAYTVALGWMEWKEQRLYIEAGWQEWTAFIEMRHKGQGFTVADSDS